MTFRPILASLLIFAQVAAPVVFAGDAAAAAAKKTVRDSLSEKQKADMRKRAWEWCRKRYTAGGGAAQVMRVEILSDGRVRCWYRG